MIPVTTDKDRAQLKEYALKLLGQNNYEGLVILIEELQDTDTKHTIKTKYLSAFLSKACINDHMQVIKYLLEHYNYLASSQEAFAIATIKETLDLVKYLLEQNAKLDAPNDLDIDRGLRTACLKGNLPMVKYLESQGADKHYMDDYPLGLAASNGHLDVVKYLVERGANIHADKDYAIRLASANGHLEVVKYLVEHGGDTHANGGDPVRWSSSNGHTEVANYLKSIIDK